IAQNTANRWSKIREREIFEKIEPVGALAPWIDFSIAEADEIADASLMRRFDEEHYGLVAVKHHASEADVEILSVVVDIDASEIGGTARARENRFSSEIKFLANKIAIAVGDGSRVNLRRLPGGRIDSVGRRSAMNDKRIENGAVPIQCFDPRGLAFDG